MADTVRVDSVGGLSTALLIALPLWALIGIFLAAFLGDGSPGEIASLALMVAAVCEAILARHALRSWLRRVARDPRACIEAVIGTRSGFGPLLRQAFALSALALAYLQYYFWDVNLQIASLQSITVFVPVPA